MEKWHEVFAGKIPREPYQMQMVNGEEQGLTIELSSVRACVMIKVGVVRAVRMLDEGMVQNNLYCEDEIKKYKKNHFQNVIYEVQEGEFGKQVNQISSGYGECLKLRHYVVVTQNYNVDIIAEWEPTIEVSKRMNIIELKKILEEENVPKEMYSLNGGLPNESYCIDQVNGQWEVYYSERGIRSSLKSFNTEEEACLYLYKCVNTYKA